MKLLKTLVPIENEGIFLIDTIEHEGRLWLVPEWIDDMPKGGLCRPARLISLTHLPHTPALGKADYVLNALLPRAVLGGHVPPGSEQLYVVRELPGITVDIQDGDSVP
ncbi:MAG: hypothetical protein A4E65_02390 [Syntrophorhabdus sp. PtaU1.Bin153]|nr:MAG: hypothetical protein A4E65_02390 [Syntrophorhabdus sp. PtaU1.Bin153]